MKDMIVCEWEELCVACFVWMTFMYKQDMEKDRKKYSNERE